MLGIKLTDGLYDESNKPYYISRSADSKLKTNFCQLEKYFQMQPQFRLAKK